MFWFLFKHKNGFVLSQMFGQIRVGRRETKKGKTIDPCYSGFEKVLCLTKSTKYGSLSPYCLVNDKGQIMENIWQFSKMYESVPNVTQRYSRFDQTVIWDHPRETHLSKNDEGKWIPNKNYHLWRAKGMSCKHPIRYPVGMMCRSGCVGVLVESEQQKCVLDETYIPNLLGYVDARKEVYLPIYSELVEKQPDFQKLIQKLKSGKNILIVEIDGPHGECLDYYQDKYGVGKEFIENNTMLATPENLNIMLYDTKFPFGHGYCLAIALNRNL